MNQEPQSSGGLGKAAWGSVDIFSIAVVIIVLLLFLAIRKKHRTTQGATVLLASGISLGPLLLILVDPLAQGFGFRSLLELVLGEGRATLWWAAAVAALHVLRDLF